MGYKMVYFENKKQYKNVGYAHGIGKTPIIYKCYISMISHHLHAVICSMRQVFDGEVILHNMGSLSMLRVS